MCFKRARASPFRLFVFFLSSEHCFSVALFGLVCVFNTIFICFYSFIYFVCLFAIFRFWWQFPLEVEGEFSWLCECECERVQVNLRNAYVSPNDTTGGEPVVFFIPPFWVLCNSSWFIIAGTVGVVVIVNATLHCKMPMRVHIQIWCIWIVFWSPVVLF